MEAAAAARANRPVAAWLLVGALAYLLLPWYFVTELGLLTALQSAFNRGEAAKKFYEWALTPQAQQFGAATRQFQLPANKATPVDPRVPDFKKIRLIDYDYAKYGAGAERKRLIARWEKDVNSLPR